MTRKLQDKIAVVTGGSGGIGLAIAKRFVAEGARVYITGRRQVEIDAAVAEIGSGATAVQADASDPAALDRLYDRVKVEAGRIDVLVANAGGGEFQPLGAITAASVDVTFASNVKGVVFTMQQALPLLAEGASVVLIASATSIKAAPNMSIYAASKAAVRSLARSWTMELNDRGIRVNTLSPGPIRTPGLLGLAGPGSAAQEGLAAHLGAGVPLGRIGDPDEIARVAVFLASADSAFVAGTELFADGGVAQV